MTENYDAIVIGGGPAGSTAAAILAEKGHQVCLVEKAKFPRYHIGESLMPYCYYTLKRLGLVDQIHNSDVPKKYSVQFAREDGSISHPFYFFQHKDHPSSTTWQVWRSEFDAMIMNKAKEHGAVVYEETRAHALLKGNNSVTGLKVLNNSKEEREIGCNLVIDASGRDNFSAVRERWTERDPKLNKVAIWTYFKNAKLDSGLDAGATTVAYLDGKGWFWYIPLSGGKVSVGIVAERDYLFNGTTKDLSEIFDREIHNNKWIKDHLEGAEVADIYRVTGEYSYRNRYSSTDGLVLAGDALGFLDPVFSTGVFLALRSGELVADTADLALNNGSVSAKDFVEYGRSMQHIIETMRKIVYAFYDKDFSFRSLIGDDPKMQSDLTDCLIGNVENKKFDDLFKAMGELAELPSPVPHGRSMADQERAIA